MSKVQTIMSDLSESEQSALIADVARRLSRGWASSHLRLKPKQISNASMIQSSGKLSPAVLRRFIISVAINESPEVLQLNSQPIPSDIDPWSTFIRSTVAPSTAKSHSSDIVLDESNFRIQQSIDNVATAVSSMRLSLSNLTDASAIVPLELSNLGYTVSSNMSSKSPYTLSKPPSHHSYRDGVSLRPDYEAELFPQAQNTLKHKLKSNESPRIVRKHSSLQKPKTDDFFVLGRSASSKRPTSGLTGRVQPTLRNKSNSARLQAIASRKKGTRTIIVRKNNHISLQTSTAPPENNQASTTAQALTDDNQELLTPVADQDQTSSVELPIVEHEANEDIERQEQARKNIQEENSHIEPQSVVPKAKPEIIIIEDDTTSNDKQIEEALEETNESDQDVPAIDSFLTKVKTGKKVQRIDPRPTLEMIDDMEENSRLPQPDDTAFTRTMRRNEMEQVKLQRQEQMSKKRKELEEARNKKRMDMIDRKRRKAQKSRGIRRVQTSSDGEDSTEDGAELQIVKDNEQDVIEISKDDERRYTHASRQQNGNRRYNSTENDRENLSNDHTRHPGNNYDVRHVPYQNNAGPSIAQSATPYPPAYSPYPPNQPSRSNQPGPQYKNTQSFPFHPQGTAPTHPFGRANVPNNHFQPQNNQFASQSHMPPHQQVNSYGNPPPPPPPPPQQPVSQQPRIIQSLQRIVGNIPEPLKRLAYDFERGDRSIFQQNELMKDVELCTSNGETTMLRFLSNGEWLILKRKA